MSAARREATLAVPDGGHVNGVVSGPGPPVVLLPEWPQTAYEWNIVGDVLAEHFEVMALDLPDEKPAELAAALLTFLG